MQGGETLNLCRPNASWMETGGRLPGMDRATAHLDRTGSDTAGWPEMPFTMSGAKSEVTECP